MGGGQRAWEEGGAHGRRAARISGGRRAKVRAETRGGGPSRVGGGAGHADGGHGAWEARQAQGARDAWVRAGTHVRGSGRGLTGRWVAWLWGSVVVVVGKGGTHHWCDACDMSLPALLVAAAAVAAAHRGWRHEEGGWQVSTGGQHVEGRRHILRGCVNWGRGRVGGAGTWKGPEHGRGRNMEGAGTWKGAGTLEGAVNGGGSGMDRGAATHHCVWGRVGRREKAWVGSRTRGLWWWLAGCTVNRWGGMVGQSG